MQTKKHPNISNLLKIIYWKLYILIIWAILCVSILVLLIFFTIEKNRTCSTHWILNQLILTNGTYDTIDQVRAAIGNATISNETELNQAYAWLMQVSKPGTFQLIDFSLLYFNGLQIPNTIAPQVAWTMRWNNITIGYAYIFICFLISIIGLILLAFSFLYDFDIQRKYKKNNLTNEYLTEVFFYQGFSLKNITDFTLSLCIIFGFFNFVTTLIMISYMFFIRILNSISKKNKLLSSKINFNISSGLYLIFVMFFLNFYTIVKGLFFNSYHVDLDLIMAIILPIGTITVIVGLYIKKLLDSKINSFNKTISNIEGTIKTIDIFINCSEIDAFKDYNFINSLPSNFKELLLNNVKNEDVLNMLKERIKSANNIKKVSKMQKNYLKYLLLYQCENNDKYQELLSNYKNFYNEEI